jgi:HptB-dependent secretion and biofilm anti anti-sigma factor
MAITSSASVDGKTLHIRMGERFDFSAHSALRAVYAGDRPSFETYIVDLRATQYMDSSALGMLLQLKEHAGGDLHSLQIKNANESIKEILAVANFDQLMQID